MGRFEDGATGVSRQCSKSGSGTPGRAPADARALPGSRSRQVVTLRRKPLRGGGQSLYLAFWWEGERHYEFLKLYLVPEVTRADRSRNAETLRVAEAVRAERHVEIVRGIYRMAPRQERQRTVPLLEYMQELAAMHTNAGTRNTWHTAWRWVRLYDPSARLDRVDVRWLDGFHDFLMAAPLKPNTRTVYYSKVCRTLGMAAAEGLIQINPVTRARRMSMEPPTDVKVLELDELRRLAVTPCRPAEIRRAFLFCCLTGLRWSDMVRLRWSDIRSAGEMRWMEITQRKTGGTVRVNLTRQARALLDEGGGPDTEGGDGVVFSLMASIGPSSLRNHLDRWRREAGLERRLTWHMSRHTFATVLLDEGVDLYTISRMLGHQHVATTEIYATVRERRRLDAINRLPDILGAAAAET